MDFFNDLFAGETIILYPLLAGLFGSIACGIVGSCVVVRRITYVASSISHTILGGVGLALFCQYKFGMEQFSTTLGALLVSLLAIILIVLTGDKGKSREDSLIGTIWVTSMSLGVVFMALTPGYTDLSSYLFGDILFVSKNDIYKIIALDTVVLFSVIVFYRKLIAICFDEEFATLRGINGKFFYFLLLLVISLCVVLMINIVGIVMVVAMLTLPASTAAFWSKHIWQMMLYACLICGLSITAGMWVSYSNDLPTGPVIVVVSALIYLLSFTIQTVRKR